MSKFRPLSDYEVSLQKGYALLPFRFSRLNGDEYVLTNDVGEFTVLDRRTLEDFAHHRLSPSTISYDDLKSRHFLTDDDSSIAIDLLALKKRTKLYRLSHSTGLHLFVATLRCEHSCPYCQVS